MPECIDSFNQAWTAKSQAESHFLLESYASQNVLLWNKTFEGFQNSLGSGAELKAEPFALDLLSILPWWRIEMSAAVTSWNGTFCCPRWGTAPDGCVTAWQWQWRKISSYQWYMLLPAAPPCFPGTTSPLCMKFSTVSGPKKTFFCLVKLKD